MIVGITGFLMIMCSLLFLPSSSAESDRMAWRIVSLGMIMIGFNALWGGKRVPAYVPEWVNRYVIPIYTLFWFVLGSIIFVLSWF
jgi:hypothetical protein